MPIFRSVALATIAATLVLVVACSAAVSLAGSAVGTVPVAKLTAKVSSHRRRLSPGTPIRFVLDTRLASRPPGGRFVLRRADYLFPRSVVVNGRRFPSCSVRTIIRARGVLRACPRGSKIGSGVVPGRAVDLGGLISRGRLTLFNGPGGRSITVNVRIQVPAIINATVSARLRRRDGVDKLTLVLPPALNTILDGDIVTSRVHLSLGATRVVDGVKRGYVEASRCLSSGKARMQGTFTFRGGAKASADAKVAC
jgi:hypothetical protein